MKRTKLYWAITGSIIALIACPVFSYILSSSFIYALILFPMTLFLWYLSRIPKNRIGIKFGDLRSVLIAAFYPIFVTSSIIVVLLFFSDAHFAHPSFSILIKNMFILLTATFIVALLTEEGFFRGWLWSILEAAYFTNWIILFWTSLVFSLWHYYAVVFLASETTLPSTIVPIYLINILLVGINFGLIRLLSGSIIICSVSHSMWNALLYSIFGHGTNTGILSEFNYQLFDPERGYMGIIINILVALFLLWLAGDKLKHVATQQAHCV
ncbi:hypothetical protein AMJ80_09260 [bacterium SM23_31]|nr:MAG: hypothetical protein AMJ80_09260 [bacterium SM23_31]